MFTDATALSKHVHAAVDRIPGGRQGGVWVVGWNGRVGGGGWVQPSLTPSVDGKRGVDGGHLACTPPAVYWHFTAGPLPCAHSNPTALNIITCLHM